MGRGLKLRLVLSAYRIGTKRYILGVWGQCPQFICADARGVVEVLCWRLVAQGGVQAFFVIVAQPCLGADAGLFEAGEDFAVEVFAAQGAVETLAEGIWLSVQLHVIKTLNRERSV